MSAERQGSGTRGEAAAKTGRRVRATAKKAAGKTPEKRTKLKDPEGGLTAAGRRAFAEKDGSHLRPGVQGTVDTPEKMKRKGSFLTRHFTHPRGPILKDGEPTRLALSAHAWGEPVPKTIAAAQRLAAKGRKLLEQYHKAKDEKAQGKAKAKSSPKSTAKSSPKSSARSGVKASAKTSRSTAAPEIAGPQSRPAKKAPAKGHKEE